MSDGRETNHENGARHATTRAARRPLENGARVRDRTGDAIGVVLDHACQYAHPKAPPVFAYLIRWQDGQVTSLSEVAFNGQGYEVVD
jgi:hypothetical protein